MENSERIPGLVSVLMPVYNAEKYVTEAIGSVRGQTYEKLEIVVLDDGSRDESLSLCRRMAEEDPRIRVYTQENAGVAAARNELLSLARGEFIAWVDSDDILYPFTIAAMLQGMEETGAQAAQCHLSEVLPKRSTAHVNEDYEIWEGDDLYRHYVQGDFSLLITTFLFRASLLEGVQFPPLVFGEDTYLQILLLPRYRKMLNFHWVGYYYRPNLSSITHNRNPEDVAATFRSILTLVGDVLQPWNRKIYLAFAYSQLHELALQFSGLKKVPRSLRHEVSEWFQRDRKLFREICFHSGLGPLARAESLLWMAFGTRSFGFSVFCQKIFEKHKLLRSR